MAKTKQTARKALQIPNLVDAVNAKVYVRRDPEARKSKPKKGMAPIRGDKKTKDKVEITITPPSKLPRNDKYLLAGPLRGRRPSEVSFSITEPRDKGNELSDSSESYTHVVSANTSVEKEDEQEEEQVEEEHGVEHEIQEEEIQEEEEEQEEEQEEEEEGKGNGSGDDEDDDNEEEQHKGNNGGDDNDDEEEENEGNDDDKDEGRDDGKTTVEDEEENAKEKNPVKRVKKDGTDIAPSARHVPATHLMLPPLRGGKLRGEPRDGGKVLFGYPGSWAHCISETIGHKDVARLFRHQSSFKKMELWPLEGECARVRDLVENSGLYNVVVNYVIAYDKVAVSSFCERYHAEVDTFQLPFGEMAITPDDAEQILGLQVEGKSTGEKFKRRPSWEDIYTWTKNLFGCDSEKTNRLFEKGPKYPKKEFKLKRRKKEGGLSGMECRYAAAGYLLYVLASVIFPDSKGNRGSRKLTSQINENLALIQVWIYDHFPSLIKDNEDVELNPKWSKGSSTGTKYLFTGSQDREQTDALIQMRQKLDNITAKEVVFNPYKNNRVGAMEDVVYYHGPLFHPNVFSMYNPIKIMRQLGFIQDSPEEDYVPPFKHKLEKLVDISWWVHADEGHEATPDYVEWYEGFSHGRVIWVDPTPGRRTNRASTSSSSQVDSRDATSILTLVRERMKLLAKAFCFPADKGEVMDPVKQRRYADYCMHIENPNAKKMFKELAKECKRSRKSRSQRAQEVAEHGQSNQHHDEHPSEVQEITREYDGSPEGAPPKKIHRVSRSGCSKVVVEFEMVDFNLC
ncbi:hypothetical protein C5167_014195 [Papaver somniferum]|uniref:Aminotransferase-like plant mobile domain-containing protein n=1 Tax=Papaver somniferum TaxID=3469 RepID=A0A4Y7J2H1_PAPSO|nr:hypothetical protein C5167_014195 [Papaver somniferum]